MGIFDTLMGKTASDASNSAAALTYDNQQRAGKKLRQAGDQYNAGMSELSKLFQPYATAGNDALGMYRAGLGLDGGEGSARFTEAYRATPGYQSALETGQNSLLQQLNASGRLNSGAAQKAAMQYGQNFEDQRSGDYLARLFGLSGMGQQATGQQVSTAGQGLQGQLGARTTAYGGDMQSAGTVGQGMVAGANAEQGAMGNLLGAATYLGGAALGGGGLGGSLTNLFSGNKTGATHTPWSYSSAFPQPYRG
jgi:hypothetical protein